MSGQLLNAIDTELADRRARREDLAAELAVVDGELAQLDGIRELAISLNGNGAVETPEPTQTPGGRADAQGDRARPRPGRKGGDAPARTSSGPRAGSAPSGRRRAPTGEKRAEILAFIAAHGEVKKAQIADAVDIGRDQVGHHLKALLDGGQIKARGATVARVYFTTANGDQEAASRGHARTSGATVPLAQLKQRVTDAIARDPGALNEDRLALALSVDREDVAVACGELLEAGDLLLGPDGTYTIDRGGVSEPVNVTEAHKAAAMAVLERIDSAITAKEVAYQAAKNGEQLTEREASMALLALEQDGTAVRFSGLGGRLAWRAAE